MSATESEPSNSKQRTPSKVGPNDYKGLLTGRSAKVLISSGGDFRPDQPAAAMNFAEPYLRAVFRFLRIDRVEFVYALMNANETGLGIRRFGASPTVERNLWRRVPYSSSDVHQRSFAVSSAWLPLIGSLARRYQVGDLDDPRQPPAAPSVCSVCSVGQISGRSFCPKVDNTPRHHALMPRQMRRHLHRLVALCLALLWGPATLCCALEAAGFEALCSDAACHSEDRATTPLDGCGVVESGKYQSVTPTIKTSPATVLVCACLACVHDLVTARELVALPSIDASDHPLDWLVTWQFVRRAAAPAHAPDSLIA